MDRENRRMSALDCKIYYFRSLVMLVANYQMDYYDTLSVCPVGCCFFLTLEALHEEQKKAAQDLTEDCVVAEDALRASDASDSRAGPGQ